MDISSIIVITLGLVLFEIISSIDNAIINAQVLSKMGEKARRWFLLWGILIAVFAVRGLLPWAIIWASAPSLGPWGAMTATFSNDPRVEQAINASAPILLMAGGIFLLFLFLHWLFLEKKNFGLKGEKFIQEKGGVWFFALVSGLLAYIVWEALKVSPMLAFGAVVGSTAFFITHGFKQNAESQEKKLLDGKMSDMSKIFYLMIIDLTFSIDGVIGAFAFTLAVPLILIGNGIGAVVVRQFTISNIDRIKKYIYLANGAMYSIFFLGIIMILEGFHMHIPHWVSPLVTVSAVAYFFMKSQRHLKVSSRGIEGSH